MVKVREDMTGWVMSEHDVPDSKLTVIEQAEDYVATTGAHYAQWLCECSCSDKTRIILRGNAIKNGNIKSCGCLRKKRNKYDLSGEYGIGFASNTNKEFYFDLEDYDKIKDYCWHESISSNGYHAMTTQIKTIDGRKNIYMHSFLGYAYHDHMDRNPLNNRKNNLRPATHIENSRNRGKPSHNTSGFIGVAWDKTRSRWISYVKLDGKFKKLGRFKNKEDAIKARLEAELKYFGEFAPQQHLFEQYGVTIQNKFDEVI